MNILEETVNHTYASSRWENRLSDNDLAGDSFRQTSFIHDPQFTMDLRPVSDRRSPPFCGFKGCQIQHL